MYGIEIEVNAPTVVKIFVTSLLLLDMCTSYIWRKSKETKFSANNFVSRYASYLFNMLKVTGLTCVRQWGARTP